ncbi:hypothetical protein [Bartonella harrusi]|uniref:Uncharacterized protein n=1 Tax=Bartonella harrusi TaxID=2961895 RepID=A0ABY5EUC9_9HYPH|nr:hypothetical protein [Bartonella harrusi]UTO28764.1 hypothetical protein NMK50_01740 [Bartonella harrusi]
MTQKSKTERHWVAHSRAFLKRYFLKHPSPFHDGACEWYNNKAIEHHHLYGYEGASRPITLFASPQCCAALGI